MPLSAREILNQSKKLKRARVEIPEWGGEVWVRELTAKERDAFEARFQMAQKNPRLAQNIRACMTAVSVCDEEGNALFTENDEDKFTEHSAAAIDKIVDLCLELSGMSPDSVEVAEKNS